jgi:hypothetical protein
MVNFIVGHICKQLDVNFNKYAYREEKGTYSPSKQQLTLKLGSYASNRKSDIPKAQPDLWPWPEDICDCIMQYLFKI